MILEAWISTFVGELNKLKKKSGSYGFSKVVGGVVIEEYNFSMVTNTVKRTCS